MLSAAYLDIVRKVYVAIYREVCTWNTQPRIISLTLERRSTLTKLLISRNSDRRIVSLHETKA